MTRGKHGKKAPKFRVARGLIAGALTLALSVTSVVTVTANTVTANVVDGGGGLIPLVWTPPTCPQILETAQSLGLEPLGPLDVAERVENTTTVNVRRGVELTVEEAGQEQILVGYVGDTVERALEANNILLKEQDQVTPDRDTKLEGGRTQIQIRRACQVTVTADGKRQQLYLLGGTVEDAIRQAGVTLDDRDSANYDLDRPVFDKMNIRVARLTAFTVTADGETKEYKAARQHRPGGPWTSAASPWERTTG